MSGNFGFFLIHRFLKQFVNVFLEIITNWPSFRVQNHFVVKILQKLLSQDMKNMEVMSRKKASQLLKNHQQIHQPGSGVVLFSKDLMIDQYDEYVAAVACSIENLKTASTLSQINQSISLCLCIESQFLKSLLVFLQFHRNSISPIFKQSNQIATRVKTVMLQIRQQQDYQQLVLIIRWLQLQSFSVILQPLIDCNNWQNYQEELCQFSLQVLQQEYVVISTIAVILKFPNCHENNPSDYLKILLAVWRRCLPAGLGAIIIEDWLNTSRPFQKPTIGLHSIKNLKPCWKLQFITHHIESCESLAGECLGID